MGDSRQVRFRRRYKKPSLRQAIYFFTALFAFFFLVWLAQSLGYWPQSWTVNHQLEPV